MVKTGWVRLYEDIYSNPKFMKNKHAILIFNYLIATSNYYDKESTAFYRNFTITRGSKLIVYSDINNIFGLGHRTLIKTLNYLSSIGSIRLYKVANKLHIAQVVNYDYYQGKSDNKDIDTPPVLNCPDSLKIEFVDEITTNNIVKRQDCIVKSQYQNKGDIVKSQYCFDEKSDNNVVKSQYQTSFDIVKSQYQNDFDIVKRQDYVVKRQDYVVKRQDYVVKRQDSSNYNRHTDYADTSNIDKNFETENFSPPPQDDDYQDFFFDDSQATSSGNSNDDNFSLNENFKDFDEDEIEDPAKVALREKLLAELFGDEIQSKNEKSENGHQTGDDKQSEVDKKQPRIEEQPQSDSERTKTHQNAPEQPKSSDTKKPEKPKKKSLAEIDPDKAKALKAKIEAAKSKFLEKESKESSVKNVQKNVDNSLVVETELIDEEFGSEKMPTDVLLYSAENEQVKGRKKVVKEKPGGSLVWDSYRDAFFDTYGVEPIRNSKTNTLCKKIVEAVGLEQGVKIVSFYLTHRGSWYVNKKHDLGLCFADLQKFSVEMKTGKQMTSIAARHIERDSHNKTAIDDAIDSLPDELFMSLEEREEKKRLDEQKERKLLNAK